MAKKEYKVFEDIFCDSEPFVYKGLALVGYSYDRSSKVWKIFGYNYNVNYGGYFYLGTTLTSTVVSKEEIKDIKKFVLPIVLTESLRMVYKK